MKTIREWLEELPDGIRERAIKNAEDGKRNTLRVCADSLSETLANAFIWRDTEEKFVFWSQAYLKARGLRSEWPSLDGLPPMDSPDPKPDPIPNPILERLERIEAELRRLTELLAAEREKSEELPESPTPLPQSLPEPWMKPLPKGAVLLGKGGTFKVPASGRFEGWAARRLSPSWWWEPYWAGWDANFYYAAPAGSEIAKLNRLE